MHSVLAHLPDLRAELDRLLGQIPRGRVTTYGDIAVALGDIKAARWVAEALADLDGHTHSEACSCHRVIRRTGGLGGYVSGDADEKVTRLQSEGIAIANGVVDLTSRWSEFACGAPLQRLMQWQDEIARSVRSIAPSYEPRSVAGVDAAFSGEQIITTCATLSFPDLETIAEWSHVEPVRFPYIPGYLAFRELPALMAMWEQIPSAQRPDLVLVDGNGQLHPRRAGIASCFGVVTGVPTIGIGKSLLCGRVERTTSVTLSSDLIAQPVVDGGEWLAECIVRSTGAKPIYASVGHLIDRDSIRKMLPRLFRGHRLPEPICRADRLSKELAKRLK